MPVKAVSNRWKKALKSRLLVAGQIEPRLWFFGTVTGKAMDLQDPLDIGRYDWLLRQRNSLRERKDGDGSDER